MKLNKKGISIIELIISVTLISIIMLFMYRLLSDITFEKDNDSIAFVNQEKRVTIIKRVEKIISDAPGIKKITPSGKTLNFSNGTSNVYQLSYNSGKLTLKESSTGNILESWNITGCTITSDVSCKSANLTDGIIYECTYKVYTENTNNKDYIYKMKKANNSYVDATLNNNNIMDDLTFSFVFWK